MDRKDEKVCTTPADGSAKALEHAKEEIAELKLEVEAWRSTARDKGASSRRAAAERDRYRAALERIANWSSSEGVSAIVIARDALTPNGSA